MTQIKLTREDLKNIPYEQRYQLLLEYIEEVHTKLDEAQQEAGFYRRQVKAKENYYKKPYSARMTA